MEIQKAEMARNILYKIDKVRGLIDGLNTSEFCVAICDMKYGKPYRVSDKANNVCGNHLRELHKELTEMLNEEVEHMQKEIEEL